MNNCLIEANAGTGKTTEIVNRYVRLLKEHEELTPENIALITFTDAAAGELRQKVGKRVEEKARESDRFLNHLLYLPSASIGTIHSFCFDILKTFGFKYEFFDLEFEIATDTEIDECLEKAVVKSIKSLSPAELRKLLRIIGVDYVDSLKSLINNVKYTIKNRTRLSIESMSVDGMVKNVIDKYQRIDEKGSIEFDKNTLEREKLLAKRLMSVLKESLNLYLKALEDKKLIDYSGILERTLELLNRCDNAREEISQKYRFVIVDEFQDTDPIQWEIMKKLKLTSSPTNFIVVGDPKQSIYRFRSADISLWNKAKMTFSVEPTLTKNYRSGKNIISFFNGIFRPIFNGEKKLGIELSFEDFKPGVNFNGNVTVCTKKQRDFVDFAIKKSYETSKKGKVGVLSYTRNGLKPFESYLKRNNIPYVKVSENPFNTLGVEEVLNLLRFTLNRDDRKSLFFLLSSRFVGMSHSEAIRAINENTYPEDVSNFLKSIDDLAKNMERDILPIALSKFLVGTKYLYSLYLTDRESFDSIELLLSRLSDEYERGKLSTNNIVREIELLRSNNGNLKRLPSSVKKGYVLSTIHGAKGLEFDSVVVVPWRRSNRSSNFLFTNLGFALKLYSKDDDFNGSPIFNMLKGVNNYLDSLEEKNLFYVALTRAKNQLILNLNRKNKKVFWFGSFFKFDAEMIEPYIDNEVPDVEFEKPRMVETPKTFKLRDVKPIRITHPSFHEIPKVSNPNPYLPKDIPPKDYGTAAHKVCECFINGRKADESVKYAMKLSENSKLEKRLMEVYKFLELHLPFLRDAKAEVPFTYRKDDAILKGRIDILLGDKDGCEIWDVKTGSFNNELFKAYSEQLRMYSEAFKAAGYNVKALKLLYIDEKRIVDVS